MFKFFKDGNKTAKINYYNVHNIIRAQELSLGRNVRVGIIDWGFGDLNSKVFSGSFDATQQGIVNLSKEHGFAMAETLKEIAPKAQIFAITGVNKNRDDSFRVECLERAVDFAIENNIKILTYSHPSITDTKSVKKLEKLLGKADKNNILTVFIHCPLSHNIMPCPLSLFNGDLDKNMFSVYEYNFAHINPVSYKQWIESNKTDMNYFLSVSDTAPVLAGCISLLLEKAPYLSREDILVLLNQGASKKNNKKIINAFRSLIILNKQLRQKPH